MRLAVRKIRKVFLYLVLLFILLIVIGFLYFLANKDEIAEQLLLGVNNEINGEVVFSDIHLNPFIQFPRVSLVLSDFLLYENKDDARNILDDPIAEFENVYVAFDIFDLFTDEISITRVVFTNGYLDITRYGNNIHNFEIGLRKKKIKVEKEKVLEKEKNSETQPSKTKKKTKKRKPFISKTLRLNLDKITLEGVHLEYNNQRNGMQSNLFFYKLIASLRIMPDSMHTSIYTKTRIKGLQISKDIEFGELGVELNTILKLGRSDSVLLIEPSQLFISRAEFNLEGTVDLKGKGFVDLKIDGADKKLGFLSLLLSNSGIENLKTGSLFFNGSLKGSFDDEIPELSIGFGVSDLSLKIPGSNDSINHLKIYGDFVSGHKEDLSDALLKIDTLKADLPEGFLDGKFTMQNFLVPKIDYKIDLSANVEGVENIFRQNYIDSLSGRIMLKDIFKGTLDKSKGWLDEKKGNLKLLLDSVSFVIPGVAIVSHLNGTIAIEKDKLHLKKLKILTGNTDLLVNGSIRNLSNLVFDEGKKIRANLSVQSSLFDFPDFFSFDSIINESFPYKVRDINLTLQASATKNELFDFSNTPRIELKIRKLNAKVDSLLKPLRIKNGRILLADYKDKTLLNLKNFTISSGKGKMVLNLNYLYGGDEKAQVKIESSIMRLGLSDVLDNTLVDSSMNVMVNPVDAKLKSSFYIENGENTFVTNFEFLADNVNYRGPKKKVRINGFKLKSDAFGFGDASESSGFSNLSGRFSFSAEKIRSEDYSFKDVVYSVDAEKGKFTLIPQNDSILGVKASGKFIISPFEKPPEYTFDYSLHQFSAGKLFVNFLEDSVLTGKVSFNIKLNFQGNDEKTILKTFNGKIKLHGKNLTLYGANVDDFLKKYKETRDFNLLDIGVIVYAGPIGLLATKGTDFARIKVTDRRKQSKIDRMISDWKIVGDSLKVEDVALRTGSNRIALKGWYSYKSDSLDFHIGVLDKKGCSILTQGFSGASKSPEMNGLGLFEFDESSKLKKEKCKPFYKGRLEHPEKK